jgi:hypothetical protein
LSLKLSLSNIDNVDVDVDVDVDDSALVEEYENVFDRLMYAWALTTL